MERTACNNTKASGRIEPDFMRDGMMGLVTGDALGVPVQFRSREEIAERQAGTVRLPGQEEIVNHPAGPVTGMEGFGTYNMPPGTWSDDSSMALATLESIRRLGAVDPDDMMENFLRWEFEGAFTPFGYAFDEGNTCSSAIWRYRDERDWRTCGKTGDHANGNGALMRILPVCIYYVERQKNVCTPDDEAIDGIHTATMLTHNHLRAKMASGLYYFMVKSIIRARETARETALPEQGADLVPVQASGHANAAGPASDTAPAEGLAAAAQANPVNAAASETKAAAAAPGLTTFLQRGLDEGFAYYRQDFRNLTEMARFSRLYDLGKFRDVPEDGIRSTGYVLDSLEAAVWCLITTGSLRDALLKAVNLGDDTDTVAAIAGGLAGLYYGYDAIPAEWLEALQGKEVLESVDKNYVNRS